MHLNLLYKGVSHDSELDTLSAVYCAYIQHINWYTVRDILTLRTCPFRSWMAFHMLQNKSHEVEQELQNYQTRSELILDCRNTNRGMRNSHMPIVAALIVLLLRPSLRFNYFIYLSWASIVPSTI